MVTPNSVEVPPPDLGHLGVRVRLGLSTITHATTTALKFAFNVGDDLRAAKAAVGHGNWLHWLAAETGLSERSAERYITQRASRAHQPPYPTHRVESVDPRRARADRFGRQELSASEEIPTEQDTMGCRHAGGAREVPQLHPVDRVARSDAPRMAGRNRRPGRRATRFSQYGRYRHDALDHRHCFHFRRPRDCGVGFSLSGGTLWSSFSRQSKISKRCSRSQRTEPL
jgi:hypothetical protein